METTPMHLRRWSRWEYERMMEAGIVRPDEPVELLAGQIYTHPFENIRHNGAVRKAKQAFQQACKPGYWVRERAPLILDPDSEPVPDLAILAGSQADYEGATPSTALLVVEIPEEPLRLVRECKLHVYAAAGIPECWILNLPERCLEIYRDPAPCTDYPCHYRLCLRLGPGDSAQPTTIIASAVPVADLLP